MITSELLEAYLACPMKSYLQSNGEKCSENEFAALYQIQKHSYRHAGIRRLEAGPPQVSARSQIEQRALGRQSGDLHSIKRSMWMTCLRLFMQSNEFRSKEYRPNSSLSALFT